MTESAPSGRRVSPRCGSTMLTLPLLALSRPATIWISVLLPQPLGPSRQVMRREQKRCEKFSSATTPLPRVPGQILETCSTTTSMARACHAPARLSSPQRLRVVPAKAGTQYSHNFQ